MKYILTVLLTLVNLAHAEYSGYPATMTSTGISTSSSSYPTSSYSGSSSYSGTSASSATTSSTTSSTATSTSTPSVSTIENEGSAPSAPTDLQDCAALHPDMFDMVSEYPERIYDGSLRHYTRSRKRQGDLIVETDIYNYSEPQTISLSEDEPDRLLCKIRRRVGYLQKRRQMPARAVDCSWQEIDVTAYNYDNVYETIYHYERLQSPLGYYAATGGWETSFQDRYPLSREGRLIYQKARRLSFSEAPSTYSYLNTYEHIRRSYSSVSGVPYQNERIFSQVEFGEDWAQCRVEHPNQPIQSGDCNPYPYDQTLSDPAASAARILRAQAEALQTSTALVEKAPKSLCDPLAMDWAN